MNGSELKKYILPFTVIFTAAAAIFRPELLTWLKDSLSGVLSPIFTGIILAAVVDPAAERTERLIRRVFFGDREGTAPRYIAITVVYVLIAGISAAVVWIVIPRLAQSTALFVNSLDGYYSDFRRRYESAAAADKTGLVNMLDRIISSLSEKLPVFFGRTFTATAEFLKGAADFAVGLVLSVYILAGKDSITDFIKGAARSVLSRKSFNSASRICSVFYRSLSSFIGGQLTEAVVLGTLCFAGMILFDFEYPLLISTVIAVTALIPVVGAFAGAIPSALVLFLAKPSSALWFIIFIIILQQLENNLIYPKIVGKSVGLPPILILIAIITGAKLAGAAGIILGIPVLSTVYTLARESISDARGRSQS